MRVLLRFSSDLCTKSRGTRRHFQRRLTGNLRDAMRTTGEPFTIDPGWSRTTVTTDHPRAPRILARVPGIHSLSVVDRHPWRDLDDLVDLGGKLFVGEVTDRKFAVRARRSGSRRSEIEFSSGDVENRLGARLLEASAGVDLDDPEITVRVDVSPEYADFYTRTIPGPGGLPLGVEGRGLALVSGGFDSAVAAWLMLRRGVRLDYLFFNLGGKAHRLGVLKVMQVIAEKWSYGTRPRLMEVDFQPVVAAIQDAVTPRYWQVVLKRLMLEAASTVADDFGRPVLVTGEAVGQVSSQTIQNLRAIEEGVDRPVLRPLTTYNKDEIIGLSRQIGTFELSAKVGEYCDILPDRPATRSAVEKVREETANVDRAVLEQALESPTIYRLRDLDDADLSTGLEVEEAPDEAMMIDLRARAEFDRWHPDGAVHLEFDDALQAYPSFDRAQTYITYCDLSLKSAHLAELMQGHGLDARYMRMSTVRRLVSQDERKAATG